MDIIVLTFTKKTSIILSLIATEFPHVYLMLINLLYIDNSKKSSNILNYSNS
jgi:hypothetical protein